MKEINKPSAFAWQRNIILRRVSAWNRFSDSSGIISLAIRLVARIHFFFLVLVGLTLPERRTRHRRYNLYRVTTNILKIGARSKSVRCAIEKRRTLARENITYASESIFPRARELGTVGSEHFCIHPEPRLYSHNMLMSRGTRILPISRKLVFIGRRNARGVSPFAEIAWPIGTCTLNVLRGRMTITTEGSLRCGGASIRQMRENFTAIRPVGSVSRRWYT